MSRAQQGPKCSIIRWINTALLKVIRDRWNRQTDSSTGAKVVSRPQADSFSGERVPALEKEHRRSWQRPDRRQSLMVKDRRQVSLPRSRRCRIIKDRQGRKTKHTSSWSGMEGRQVFRESDDKGRSGKGRVGTGQAGRQAGLFSIREQSGTRWVSLWFIRSTD